MSDDQRLSLAAGVNYQTLGPNEDAVLLSMESGYLYRCNGSAVQILDLMAERPTIAELRSKFAAQAGIAPSKVDTDVDAFIEDLVAEQLIVKAA